MGDLGRLVEQWALSELDELGRVERSPQPSDVDLREVMRRRHRPTLRSGPVGEGAVSLDVAVTVERYLDLVDRLLPGLAIGAEEPPPREPPMPLVSSLALGSTSPVSPPEAATSVSDGSTPPRSSGNCATGSMSMCLAWTMRRLRRH